MRPSLVQVGSYSKVIPKRLFAHERRVSNRGKIRQVLQSRIVPASDDSRPWIGCKASAELRVAVETENVWIDDRDKLVQVLVVAPDAEVWYGSWAAWIKRVQVDEAQPARMFLPHAHNQLRESSEFGHRWLVP